MLYRVRARPINARRFEFYKRLTDGTIATQEPDGQEIVASMQRATLNNGWVVWTETCYCNTPLHHERTTVYDQFFTDMQIEPATTASEPNETGFWNYLKDGNSRINSSTNFAFASSMSRTLGRGTI